MADQRVKQFYPPTPPVGLVFLVVACVYIKRLIPRDAMLARYMLSSCVCPSVRPSIRPFVQSRHCTKTAKHRITHKRYIRLPKDYILTPKISVKFERGHPTGAPNRDGVG